MSTSSWVKPDWDVNYFVPNFGVDKEIVSSLNHMHAAEGRLGHTMKASFKKPKGHDVDYFVPNFGADHDIALTRDNIIQSETYLSH